MKRKCALLLLVLGLLIPGMAAALGLGQLTLKSYLNEPLVAEVKLLEIGDLDPSQIRVRLGTREDFDRAGVERAYFLTSLRFEVVGTPSGGAILQIRSSDPVREPYLDFIVEARWPSGRLLREYTVLLDPPIFVGDDSGITARASATQRSPGRPTGGGGSSQPSESSRPSSQRAAVQRQYDAGATDRPTSGEQYLVQRSDTLWKIAASGRPSGASVQQTMLDIQRMNPEAFIGGNINQLKAGYVLRMPSASDITPQSFEEAVAEVERQSQRWQSGVSSVDRLDASEGLDVSGVAGRDSGEGHLQIAGVDNTDEAPMGGDVSARMEDLDRTRRENIELGTRLSAMEDQMEMQERLISLKDEQIAALQAALDRAGGEVDMPAAEQEGTIEQLPTPEPAPAEPEPAPAPAPAPQPAPQPAPVAPPAPTILDMVMDNIIYVAAGVLVLLLLVVFLLRNKLNLQVPKLGRGKKDQELPVAAAAVGSEDEFADVSLSEDSLVVDEFDENTEEAGEEVEAPEPAASSYSSTDEQYAAQFESGDALAEADIYIAYGRFPQAVDLLKAAIAVEPVNTDYRIKLMEACVEMVESGEFQQQYADLQVIGDENVLQRARSLLEAVDGGEVWLDDLPEPGISAADVEAARAGMASSAAAVEEPLDLGLDVDLDDDAGLDADLDELAEGGDDAGLELDEAALTELDDESEELGLDFDDSDTEAGLELDSAEDDDLLGGTDLEDAGLELADFAEDSVDDGADESAALEFELDTDEPEEEAGLEFEMESTADDLEAAEDAVDSAMELEDLTIETGDDEAEDDLESLALDTGDDADDLADIELPDLELDGLEEEPSADADDDLLADLDGLDVDLGDDSADDLESMSLSLDDDDDAGELTDLGSDLGSDLDDDLGSDLELGGLDDGAAGSSDDGLDLGDSDLDGVDFDLSGDADDENLADMELDMSADGGDDDEGLMFAADGDEVATKLDLARAYIDMGDHEGARSILEEVMEGGSEAQQGEARQLLEGID